jgi:ATP-dependent RNA helicase DDX1
MTAFEEMGVIPEIAQAVEDMDWTLPTDIQSESIPLILGGGDVLMAAETGSGKTGAFCLPVIQIVHETLMDIKEGKSSKRQTSNAIKVSLPKKAKVWEMNPFDRGDSMAIDPEGYTCQARDANGWHGTRSTKGVSGSGKYYFEAMVSDEGLCRVGYSTSTANLDLGTDNNGYGFGGTGKKSYGKQFDTYGEPFGKFDVVGNFLDLDNHTLKWSKNGNEFGIAFDLPKNLQNESFFAAVVLKNAEMEFNFGQKEFKHGLPEGYVAFDKAVDPNVVVSPNFGNEATGSTTKATLSGPQAIIIEPSRELAEQTFNQIIKFKKLLNECSPREVLIVGGEPAQQQIAKLQQGIDIVVGTPGRLEDLISTGKLTLGAVRFFILDECDGLLSQGYTDLINRLHAKIPKVTVDGMRLQMIVCSATLHNFDVKKMSERIMNFPTWVDLKGQDSVPDTVHHTVLRVDPKTDLSWQTLRQRLDTDAVHQRDRLGGMSAETLSEAVKLLKGEYTVRAIQVHKMDKAIIFCRTKLDCDNLERYLKTYEKNFPGQFTCVCLHGDRPPPQRKANLEAFKKSQVRFLICTDVAARGLDVSGLPFVINVTLPGKISYIFSA